LNCTQQPQRAFLTNLLIIIIDMEQLNAKNTLDQSQGTQNDLSSSITRVETGQRMSRIVKHNNTIYLCGQVADDPSTSDITQQTRTMLAKVDSLLETAGSDREHILSATVYVKDMATDFEGMNAVWDAWVPEGHAPARACVQASMARPELLVEISVIAAEK
jgi:enamine deaminase RidA (YjgF/YER057c/UK114 family)